MRSQVNQQVKQEIKITMLSAIPKRLLPLVHTSMKEQNVLNDESLS